MESCEYGHQCFVCGVGFSSPSRHLFDELSSCNMRFEDKLCQILSYDKPSERGTDVCESCWSLIENIARQQNELCLMIEEVNDRLARSLQQNHELKSEDGQENESEVGLYPCLSLECSCSVCDDECTSVFCFFFHLHPVILVSNHLHFCS